MAQLARLLAAAGGRLEGPVPREVAETIEVRSVVHDSRKVAPGAMFCCVPGVHVDGHDFAPAAVEAGAVALLCERTVDASVAQVITGSVREAMAPVAAELHDHPSHALRVIGVTGTDGKSTTTHLLASVLRAAGWETDVHGNLGVVPINTPEAPDVQERLAAARDRGRDAVVMEVSSPALIAHRVDATWFAAAVFTNLTRDHLDIHGTVEAYFEAKALLFQPTRTAMAIVNGDDRWGTVLIERLEGTLPVHVYRLADATDVELGPDGSRFQWGGCTIELQMPGLHNVSNALAAATTARALGVDDEAVARGLSGAAPLGGRMELIEAGQPFTVVVDYAHTPDGLEHVLGSARHMTGGRVILVFGAGGDKDRGKRPLMGEVAGRLADLVIVTSDNPRSEDPGAIIAQVLGGVDPAAHVTAEVDREAAIALALAQARPGDLVLIAGKGHETGQTIGPTTFPFDDREVARRLLGGDGA